MDGAGANRVLIARERRRQQRPGVDAAALDRVTMWSAASPAPPAASASQSLRSDAEQRDRQGNRLARERRHAARELGGEVLRRQRQPGQPAASIACRQLDDEGQQPPLEVDGRLEVGRARAKRVPAAGRSGEQFLARERTRTRACAVAAGQRCSAGLT